ncbi:MAG: molybdate ABC transporter substrate-binding protein [Deferribacterales bacterium]
MKKIFILIFFLITTKTVLASSVNVYCAADLVYAMDEIKKEYLKLYPQDDIKFIFGSSGKGYTQIINGAPYDIVFSADMEYVIKLESAGFTISEPKPYAVGRIVIWKRKKSDIDLNKHINSLLNPNITKIAIADWSHAPYGVAAKECLEHFNIFDKVKSKFVLGENISQTAQFVQLGAADIGILAYSVALSEKLKKDGDFILLPTSCHSEIKQGYAILKNAQKDKEKLEISKRFYNFVTNPKAREIFIKYGFTLPGEVK